MLYVCPECGDINCGAVTAMVEEEGDQIVWKQFGHERGYHLDGQPLADLSQYEAVGPFRFAKRQYRETLTNWPARV
jgi:hypothetical protein